jgi:hypothetical protein
MPSAVGYTKAQLDMRRKAEVLQYNKSASQTTGQMTKKGKYAKLFTIAGNNNICPLDLYLPTPSSSSNVPGPVTTIQYNESVPLYNYASEADNYANLNLDLTSQFELYSENNILVRNDSTVKVATLLINNPSSSNRTFTIQIPIGLYIASDASGSTIYESVYNISSVLVGAYYNGALVPGTSSTSEIFSGNKVKIRSNTAPAVFSGVLYVGCLTATILLPTEKGFVYELRMSATIVKDSGFVANNFGMFVNISKNLLPINCSIVLDSGSVVPPINPGEIAVT